MDRAEWENGYVQLEPYERAVAKNTHRLAQCGLLAELRPGMRVLDLCCGLGTTLAPVQAAGSEVTGLDLSHALLARARTHGFTRLVCADTCVLPFGTDVFDAVIIQGGLHHLWDEQFERALSEIDRVLKPGGLFAFTEPCNTWALRLYLAMVDGPLANLTAYTRNWRKTLAHERDTYMHWMQSQGAGVQRIAGRMELLRFRRGLVTMFGLARSRKAAAQPAGQGR